MLMICNYLVFKQTYQMQLCLELISVAFKTNAPAKDPLFFGKIVIQ